MVEWMVKDNTLTAAVSGGTIYYGTVTKSDLDESLWAAGIWIAGAGTGGCRIKQDASLIEALNWVEEELKFRWSHG